LATIQSWQNKLAAYKTDKASAQSEIQRAKDVYAKATTASAKAAANKWANQVRQASGIGMDDATYGNNKATFGKPANSVTETVVTPKVKTPEELAREYAESQATSKYNASKDAITAMMDRLQKQRESSIKSAEMGAEASRQGLEASAFKSAREAQQATAGRGLSGSGLAADVMARQGMAKQSELAALYGNLNKTTADINQQADLSNAELNQELKTLEANKGAMTEEMYQAQLDRLQNRKKSEFEMDMASKTFEYNKTRDVVSDEQWNKSFEYNKASDREKLAYQKERDKITDTQWKKEFDEDARRFGLNYALESYNAKTSRLNAVGAPVTGSGTVAGVDYNPYVGDITATYNNAYAETEGSPKEKAKAADLAARKVLLGLAHNINGNSSMSKEQKKEAMDFLMNSTPGTGKNAKAEAYKIIGVKSTASPAKTTTTTKTTTTKEKPEVKKVGKEKTVAGAIKKLYTPDKKASDTVKTLTTSPYGVNVTPTKKAPQKKTNKK
jgi:hypothetical protein